MNPYLVCAIIGVALEVFGFLFALINMANGAGRMLSGRTDSFGSTFKRHLVAIAFCFLGSLLLVGTGIAFLISKLS